MNTNNIIYQTQKHWILLIKPIVMMIIGFPFLLSLFFVQDKIAILFCVIVGILYPKGLYNFLLLKKVKIILFEKSIVTKAGIISVAESEIALKKIEEVQVYQSLLGRIFNYGDIIINKAGSFDTLYHIKNPFEFKNFLQQQIYSK